MTAKSNEVFGVIVFILVLKSEFSPKMMVIGSPVQEPTFKRPDAIRGFKTYIGGYNITNKHYWASAAFTGVHGYAIAIVWVLCGLSFGFFVIFENVKRNGSSQVKDQLDCYYFLMFTVIILFTLLSIVASSCVLASNENTLHRTNQLKRTIVKAGQETHRTIYRVVTVMTKIQSLLHPYDLGTSTRLYTVSHLLANQSQKVQFFVKRIVLAVDLETQTSHVLHLVVVSIDLVLLVSSVFVLLLHWHPGFIAVIFICWILTTICWVLTGLDFFLHTIARDSCTAFQDFQQNPQNSSLSSIIPCLDPTHSIQLLAEVGNTLHGFISQLNAKIRELFMLLAPDMHLSGLGTICNPLSGAPNYTYMPETCPKDAILVGDLPNILSSLTCYKENSETCKGEGKVIPETFYEMASAYSYSVQNMIDILPYIESLTKCIIVKRTVSDILKHQCKAFRLSIRLLWSSMLSLSVFMVVLTLTWVAKSYQEKGRCFSRWSIVPNNR